MAVSSSISLLRSRPAPKAKRLDDVGYRENGGFKSPFINMRNTVVGSWHVVEYLYAQDQATLDSSWTEHWWLCRCIHCNTEAILERRQIRSKSQRKCPVCVASKKALRSREAMLAKLRPKSKRPRKTTVDWGAVRELTLAGLSNAAIAERLKCSTATVVNSQQRMGLKKRRLIHEEYVKLTYGGSRSPAERRAAIREKQRKARLALKAEKIANGTYRGRGRPRKAA